MVSIIDKKRGEKYEQRVFRNRMEIEGVSLYWMQMADSM